MLLLRERRIPNDSNNPTVSLTHDQSKSKLSSIAAQSFVDLYQKTENH
ncbi:hypothetical protein B0I21_11084 [Sphingobacterium paludis]|uniref:Uncharacterized protein n=1 Tax=Sphingobacterium paludis TaxID=1476465 RepID=A0A4R7CRP0_9SPHI|nr:hypothetical protein B0I21_11084 [Sphingobacterium paludis]